MTDKKDHAIYMAIQERATAYAGNEPQWALVWLFLQLLEALGETNEHLEHLAAYAEHLAAYAEQESEQESE